MKRRFRDLALWRQLAEETTHLDSSTAEAATEHSALIADLGSLAAQLPLDRAMHFARLPRWLAHPSPEVRGAALDTLRGAAGPEAFRYLLEGLADPATQDAAFAALVISAEHDPSRWWHVLLHPDDALRERAIQAIPKGFPLHQLLALLPDQANRALVMEMLTPLPHEPQVLPMLLALVHARELSRLELLRWLIELPWERSADTLLGALSSQRTIDDLPEKSAEVERFLTAPTLPRDAQDDLFLIMWQEMERHPQTESAQLSRALLNKLWAAATGTMQRKRRILLAISMGRVGFHQWYWEPAPLALCAMVFPDLLTHRMIPIATRKAAARHAIGGCTPMEYITSPLSSLLSSDLCYGPDGQLDLSTLAGVLHLVEAQPYRELAHYIRHEDLCAALHKTPEHAADFFSRYPEGKAEEALHQRFLRDLLSAGTASPTLLAQLTLVLPANQVRFLGQLKDRPDAEALTLFQALLDAYESRQKPPSPNKTRRLAAQLLPLLRHQCAEAFATMAALFARETPWPTTPDEWQQLYEDQPTQPASTHKGLALATELLTVIGRHVPPLVVCEAVVDLPAHIQPAWLLLEQCTPLFPYEVEQAIAVALHEHETPWVLGWQATLTTPSAPKAIGVTIGRDEAVQLSPGLALQLVTAPEHQLKALLEKCFTHLVTGLTEALKGRRPGHSNETCSALLVCHDPPEEVAIAFQRSFQPTNERTKTIDVIMTTRCERMTEMSLLGAAWMYRWERHRAALETHLRQLPGGFHQGLHWALHLASPYLGLQIWQGVRLTMQQWRWHDPASLKTHFDTPDTAKLLRGVLLHNFLSEEEQVCGTMEHNELVPFQVAAAEMVELLHSKGHHIDTFQALRLELLSHLSAMAPAVRSALVHWLNTRQRAYTKRTFVPPPSVPPALLEEIRASEDLALLKGHCHAAQRQVVEEAVMQLLLLDDGVEVLLSLWQGALSATSMRVIASTISMWPDAPPLTPLRDMLENPETPAMARFFLALGLCERGEDTWDQALATLHESLVYESVVREWSSHDDWRQLAAIAPRQPGGLQALVYHVIDTPHTPIAAQALRHILLQADPLKPPAINALLRFLEATPEALQGLRLEVALRLRAHARLEGLPLQCAHIYNPRRKAKSRKLDEMDFFVGLPAAHIIECVEGGLIAGVAHVDLQRMLQNLSRPGVDPDGRQAALLAILRKSPPGQLQQMAMAQLRPTKTRVEHLQRLAQTFAWGVLKGRELTGKMFGIEMIGGDDFGYTRLTSPKVFINPLPLLRREQHGEAVVKGLILHEFGHHIYHADEIGMQTWEQAKTEQLHSLLNLVSDEQLERSLRAKDRAFGDDLKHLASYAFQHAERAVSWSDLLGQLGPSAFTILCGADLGVSRKRGHTIVQMGHLLYALEAQGRSFARFVRALRMGLGNRHNDPKVAEALRLFRKQFRHSTMPEMLEITRSLRDIFGDEVQLLDLIGQEHCMGPDDEGVITIGEGMTQEELQQEIERVLRGGRRQPEYGKPTRVINVAKGERFTQIATVKTIPHDRAAHRRYAIQTARWSRKMRTFLQRLGLGMVPQRKRLTGHRLDRGQLQNAVLRNDPRLLVARKIQFKTDLFLGILIDCSGSMEINDNIERARLFASMIAEAAAPLKGIDARFIGFTDSVLYDAGNAGRCAAHGLEVGGGNNDAAALWHAIKLALASPRKARLIVMISDGSPTECTVEALRALVNRASDRMGICCAQIALRKLDHVCFPHYVEVLDDNADLAIHKFGTIIAQLVQKAIA